MTCGIYTITNKTTGKQYVGSSKDIEKRWKQHLTTLRSNRHANVLLQNAWNKYGSGDFEFSILEICSLEELIALERTYLLSGKFSYNIGKDPVAPMWGMPRSEETKLKISASLKGHPVSETMRQASRKANLGNKHHSGKKHSAEARRKMSEAQNRRTPTFGRHPSEETLVKLREAARGNTNWLGKHHSEETKKNWSIKRLGRKLSEETKRKIGLSNIGKHSGNARYTPEVRAKISAGNTGKKHSEEWKQKMRIRMLGRKMSEEAKEKMRQAWILRKQRASQ